MQKTFEATYENGVLRPLENLGLTNGQHVKVSIADISEAIPDIAAYFDPAAWEAAKHDDISLEAVRQALSSIKGSLSEAVIESRADRF